MILSDFHSIRPPHETSQQESLDWFIAAHTQAERTLGKNEEELALFKVSFEERINKVACKPDRIAKRGHILSDFLHRNWDEMSVYRLKEMASGKGLDVRVREYSTFSDRVFEEFYHEIHQAPDDLIHVTCTGYVSPSGAQKLVSKKGWGQSTTVTHAYHMGCYGSIPAIRMAKGFLAAESDKKRVDIVHTEICCLHSNPSLHQLDQLVSQSLFADGFIKYSVSQNGAGLITRSVKEEIIPNSMKAMTWNVVDWGFEMFLAKEVPVLIARSLEGYLARLAARSGWSVDALLKNALFAVHPGGPKILIHIQDLLKLSDDQMKFSFQILREFGNMSSGTLPHIWKAIVEDASIPDGVPVVSLAFGPGLSICGAILEKRCGGQH